MKTQLEDDFDKLEAWFKCEYGDLEDEDEESEPEEEDDNEEE